MQYIIVDDGVCFLELICELLMKSDSSYSQLSSKLERNIVNRFTLTGKQTEMNTQRKLSNPDHVIISIFLCFILSHA